MAFNNIPIEDIEAESLATWLKYNKYKFTHIPHETPTKRKIVDPDTGRVSWVWWHTTNRKNKAKGVVSWFPDYCIILKRGSLLFIELKRQKQRLQNWKLWASPSKVSDEQKEWVATLWSIENVMACICYWWQDAMQQILYYENL